MSKSTEKELSELHGVVAKVLKAQLEEEITVTDEDGTEQVLRTASPATISAAIKFLKDNDITSSVDDDENMSGLAETLERQRAAREERKEKLRLVSIGNE